MFPLYSLTLNSDGSYNFTSDQSLSYLIYFSEYLIIDADNNEHKVYNFGFTRDGAYENQLFNYKYDEKIRNTIISVINDFFIKFDHKALLYFCFGEDGLARHRNIAFKKWAKHLDDSIESHNRYINYTDTEIFGSIMVSKENPLKNLIINAFEKYIAEISGY